MEHGYTFLGYFFPHENQILLSAVIIASVLVLVTSLITYKIRKNINNYIVPDDKFSLRFLADSICSFMLSLSDDVMGKHNRRYLPFVATIFVYILFLNLSGLIPGVSTPTGGDWPQNVAFNFGIAIMPFVFYNIVGIYKNGFWNYLKHFCGGDELLKPALLVVGLFIAFIEVISNCLRPITLSIRLYGNMTGDHAVLATFLSLTPWVVPVIFYALGTFICMMQAFVFTLLSMVYIGLVTEEHEEH